jgi:hypothetical protein
MPKPTVEQRLRPDYRAEITANVLPTVESCEAVDHAKPTFCPRCAVLGQHVLMSGTHIKRNGVVISEFGCPCGHTKVVEYHAR